MKSSENISILLTKAQRLTTSYLLKGYLRYKTITSQNVPSGAQIKNFFISQKNYVPFSRYSNFLIFNHPMIYQICDIRMSIQAWQERKRQVCGHHSPSSIQEEWLAKDDQKNNISASLCLASYLAVD